jgi:hypothetical protein
MDNQIDIIKSEHHFMRVGDPVPVLDGHDHDSHIANHQKELDAISNDDQEMTKKLQIDLLKAHIELHKEFKNKLN